MANPHVIATYLVESYLPLEQAAAAIAGEQSTGTFIAVARESAQLKETHAARVVDIELLPAAPDAVLPGATQPDGVPRNRGIVRIAFPLRNFGPSIPNLLAAVAGNVFELRQLAAVRLLDLDLPIEFHDNYPGPQFGPAGTRRLMAAGDGVLIGAIVKPSIGLPPDELRLVVRELAGAGVDFIKDDELTGNPPHSPLAGRVEVVTQELDRVAQRTGHKPMYAFNITDDIDRLAANHDLVADAGGSCVMVCINLIGLAGLAYLRRRSDLPIHGNRTMTGLFTRAPQLGIDFVAWQKLARLCGADHLHTNGLSSKFYETDEQVLASITAVRRPIFGGYETLPVLSSGQWAGLAPLTFQRTGTTELLVLAGGGIHGHPDGAAAGVESMREAWRCAVDGIDLTTVDNIALRHALESFGPVGG